MESPALALRPDSSGAAVASSRLTRSACVGWILSAIAHLPGATAISRANFLDFGVPQNVSARMTWGFRQDGKFLSIRTRAFCRNGNEHSLFMGIARKSP